PKRVRCIEPPPNQPLRPFATIGHFRTFRTFDCSLRRFARVVHFGAFWCIGREHARLRAATVRERFATEKTAPSRSRLVACARMMNPPPLTEALRIWRPNAQHCFENPGQRSRNAEKILSRDDFSLRRCCAFGAPKAQR